MENKKNGVNGILVVIIVILLGVIAFCAYKIGTTGRCVVDDENLPKGGNTSVPVENNDTTEDKKDATNSDDKVEDTADSRFKKYAENLKAERSKYKDYNGYKQWQFNRVYGEFSLSPTGDLIITKNESGKKVVENNVLSFYLIEEGNAELIVLYAIKEDGTVTHIDMYKNGAEVNVKKNYADLKNIIQILPAQDIGDYSGAAIPIFIDIDGKKATPNYNNS